MLTKCRCCYTTVRLPVCLQFTSYVAPCQYAIEGAYDEMWCVIAPKHRSPASIARESHRSHVCQLTPMGISGTGEMYTARDNHTVAHSDFAIVLSLPGIQINPWELPMSLSTFGI